MVNIMNEKKVSHQIRLGAVLGYVNFIAKTVIQLLYVPLMLRFLGQNEYGVYQLVASLISYLSLLNFGFGGAYLRFYAQCKNDSEKQKIVNSTFLLVFSFFAILALFVGFLITFNSDVILGNKMSLSELALAKKLLVILTINMALTFPISVFTSIVTAKENFVFLKCLDLLKNILNPFFVIILLLLGYGSIGMVLVTTILTIISGIITIYYSIVKLKVKFNFHAFEFSLVKEISVFSSFLFLNSIIEQINWNVDKFILGRAVGTTAIAVYSVGAQINNIYIQITDMLASVLAPKINKLVASEKESTRILNDLFIKVGRLQAYIIMLILFGFILYGKEFIYFWAGKGYDEAYYVTLLLIVPISIPLCQTIGVDIQQAMNKHQYRSIVYAIIAVGNVLISIPLAIHFGAIGAAMGTAIGLIVGNGIIMNIIYDKIIGLDVIKFWRKIIPMLKSTILPIICGITMKYFWKIDSLIVLCFEAVVFSTVYFLSIYFISMNTEEKSMVKYYFNLLLKNRRLI